jgi:tetratricopeptide (TPR) repeat protein
LRLFNACRAGDAAGLKAMVAERRKPHPIRAYHVALAAIKKHDAWAYRILQNRGTEMDRFLVHELAVRIGQAALNEARFDLASSAYLDAVPLASETDIRASWGMAIVEAGRNNLEEACHWAQEAISRAPHDPSVRNWFAGTLIRKGDIDGAARQAEAGLQHAPTNTGLLLCMADIEDRRGNLDDAMAWVRLAIAAEPNSAYFHERLIQLLMRQKKWETARQAAGSALEAHPGHIGLLRCLSDIAERQDKLDEAVSWSRRVLEVSNGNLHSHFRLIHLLMRQKSWVDAKTSAVAALAQHPRSFELSRSLADICDQSGELTEAVEWMRQALDQNESDISLREKMARLLLRQGKIDTAKSILISSLELEPSHLGLLCVMADACFQAGEFDQCVFWTRKASLAAANDLGTLRWLIGLLLRAEQFDAAVDLGNTALNNHPDSVQIMGILADVHERISEFGKAIEWSNRVMLADPLNLHARERYAHMLLRDGKVEEAQAVLARSLEMDPCHFGTLRYMADVMVRRRRPDAAIGFCLSALELAPRISWFREWFSWQLRSVGDLQAASRHLDLALRDDPTNQHMLTRRAVLQKELVWPKPWEPAEHVGEYGVNWRARHLQLVEAAKKAPPNVLFLGDSITDQWAGPGREPWNEHFALLHAFQMGISGDTTQGLLWRILNGALEDLSPEVILVLIGTNNIGRNLAPTICMGIEAIWHAILRICPSSRLVAVGLTPREHDPDTWFRRQTEEINGALAVRAQRCGIAFLRVDDCLLDPDGTLSQAVSPDGVHFSTSGYERLALRISGVL